MSPLRSWECVRGFHWKSPKSDRKLCFLGERVITFMCTGCSFKSYLKYGENSVANLRIRLRKSSELAASSAAATIATLTLTSAPIVSINASVEPKLATTLATRTRIASATLPWCTSTTTVAALTPTSTPTISISASAEAKLATTLATRTRIATTAVLSHRECYCTRDHNKSHQQKLSLHLPHPHELQQGDSNNNNNNNTGCTKRRADQASGILDIQKSNSRSSLNQEQIPTRANFLRSEERVESE